MTASLGLRSKTGRAVAVVLGGSIESPQVLRREDLVLADPRLPDTGQPYHAVMHLPWPEAEVAVQKAASAVQKVASMALAQLLREVQSQGVRVCGVGVVGSGDRDLAKIGNYHIRAHAAEGVLFRRVLEVAAEANGLRCQAFLEKGLYERAQSALRRPEVELRRVVLELGQGVVRPWRADEKAAAITAWLVMSAFGRR